MIAKAALAGVLVVAFSLAGGVLKPKWFAGLFGAAPAVALGGLTVAVLAAGDRVASREALGMVFGAVGFVAFALLARLLLRRLHAAVASGLACLAWAAVAIGAYEVVLR